MNGVIGMTGLLLDTKLNSDQREFAETIRSSGDALLTIINDILDFSKIEAGKLQFETLDFDLNNTIEDSVESLADKAIEKRIELASFIDGDLPTALQGDPGRLRQVLTNLIGNALKFTTEGEVVVRAEKDGETENDVIVRFTVNDTGIGISEAALPHLFKAFIQGRRIDNTKVRRHRPGACNIETAGRTHGRPDWRRQHSRRRLSLLVHGPLPETTGGARPHPACRSGSQ